VRSIADAASFSATTWWSSTTIVTALRSPAKFTIPSAISAAFWVGFGIARTSCETYSLNPGAAGSSASARPITSWAMSADPARAVYQYAPVWPSTHCRASVVFPYPAGAISRIVRAVVSSSSLSSRGRSMMRRTPFVATLGSVACAIASLLAQT
jgi:hypothetical protein